MIDDHELGSEERFAPLPICHGHNRNCGTGHAIVAKARKTLDTYEALSQDWVDVGETPALWGAYVNLELRNFEEGDDDEKSYQSRM